jgi:hypothetical protein
MIVIYYKMTVKIHSEDKILEHGPIPSEQNVKLNVIYS